MFIDSDEEEDGNRTKREASNVEYSTRVKREFRARRATEEVVQHEIELALVVGYNVYKL